MAEKVFAEERPDLGGDGAFHFAGPFYTWWRGDPVPDLPPLPGFAATPTDDARFLSRRFQFDEREFEERIRNGHVPYVAFLKGEPVAFGWSARSRASIGELGIEFGMPEGNRYLWDFVTLPAWRGRGIYPRLLQEILKAESRKAGRFWIGHEPENRASGRGIAKAGFQVVGEVWVRDGSPIFVARNRRERAAAAASLLQLPLLTER